MFSTSLHYYFMSKIVHFDFRNQNPIDIRHYHIYTFLIELISIGFGMFLIMNFFRKVFCLIVIGYIIIGNIIFSGMNVYKYYKYNYIYLIQSMKLAEISRQNLKIQELTNI